MKIRYVEELVGMTKKNIRFYEEQGLLSVERAENGYREYGQEDVCRLKQVKLLRKLGISIEDIKRVFQGGLRLEDCLDRYSDALERQKENLSKLQSVSRQMINAHVTLQNLDADCYLEQIEKLEKEGEDFMDIERKDVRRKKRRGAMAAGLFVIIYIIFVTAAAIIWGFVDDTTPVGVLLAALILSAVVVTCVIVVLIRRMKEIEGGEEDEAAKY